ncbi:MAG: RNA-binding protein [Bryobacteraceae bacterium]|nr:RNA-binding protein [Bryobacteraceae bacterium]MDW8377195.1 RNA-binding protein [Bryobacterales bacterium]
MKNIFVGNLSFGSTEEDVRAMFEQYGSVDRVSVITDRETGRSRGFAFVEMGDDAEADRAIASLNGAQVAGRTINVNEARPKSERPMGGFSERRGGSGRGRGSRGSGYGDRY